MEAVTEKIVVKNTDGHLGPICHWCGGYGFLNSILGGAQGCQKCSQTGVEQPSIAELMKRISDLESRPRE